MATTICPQCGRDIRAGGDCPRCAIEKAAEASWRAMTPGERRVCLLGIFPAERMAEAERALEAAGVPRRDMVRQLAVALMERARRPAGQLPLAGGGL
jgi:hypothetical protein